MIRSADHRTFVIERMLDAEIKRAYAAWSNEDVKSQWMACDDDMVRGQYTLDFRVGGIEVNHVTDPDGVEHIFEGYYLDIIEPERIIYSYTMRLDHAKVSASIVTLQFAPRKDQTLMIYTEQIAFLDGHQDPDERIRGTEEGFKMLDKELARVSEADDSPRQGSRNDFSAV